MREGRSGAVRPRLVLILSENWTLVPARNLGALVRMAVEAEAAGFDAAMVSEHVVLGPGADANGVPGNPRDYALPGNQDPSTPWPDALTVLAAVGLATSRLRLVASSIIAPLRHPLLLAKQLASVDVLTRGRLIISIGVGSVPEEAEAMGAPMSERGRRANEYVEAMVAIFGTARKPRPGRSGAQRQYERG